MSIYRPTYTDKETGEKRAEGKGNKNKSDEPIPSLHAKRYRSTPPARS
jgi:hypothetical protein